MNTKNVLRWITRNLPLRRLTAMLLCLCMVLSVMSVGMPTALAAEAEPAEEDTVIEAEPEAEDTEEPPIPEADTDGENDGESTLPDADSEAENTDEGDSPEIDAGVEGDSEEDGLEAGDDSKSDSESGEEHWSLSYNFIVREPDSGQFATTRTYANDLSSLEYTERTNFTVTVQLNYRNSNQIMDYNAGELTLSVPNLMYGRSAAQIECNNISFGVSTDESQNYSWRLANSGTNYGAMETFQFKNERAIKKDQNFEGSIQITYSMDSLPENVSGSAPLVEPGIDSCLHAFSSHDRVSLDTIAESIYSNYIDYAYTREYVHTFKDAKYSIVKKGVAPISIDGILTDAPEENIEDYYWVQWQLTISVGKGEMWRYATKLTLADAFPDECVIYSTNLERLEKTTFDGQEFYIMEIDPPEPGGSIIQYYYVGYPKAIFNQNNLGVENTAYVYAKMQGKEDEGFVYHDQSTDFVNLGNFDFKYDTGYYAIGKKATSEETKYYQSVTGADPELNGPFTYELYPIALYTGFPMDVRVGDDMLYIHSASNTFRRLQDNEYYFSQIQFPGRMYDGNGSLITRPYEYELYVRRAGSDAAQGFGAYEKYATGTYTPNSARTFTLTKTDAVVAYYFEIKGMEESLAGDMIRNADGSITLYNNYTIFRNAITITGAEAAKTAKTGLIYNFDWINVFDQNGELQNVVDRGSYVNMGATVTGDMLADQDMDTYGHYMQRDEAYNAYETMTYPDVRYIIWAAKSMTSSAFDAALDGWPLHADLNLQHVAKKITDAEAKYLDGIPEEDWLLGWDFVDVLPDYTEVLSTPEEIIDSFSIPDSKLNSGTKFYCRQENGSFREISKTRLEALVKENASVELADVNGFRCLRVIIDLSEHPLVISGPTWNGSGNPTVNFETHVNIDLVYKYEGYLSDKTNGRRVDNEFCGYYHGRQGKFAAGYRNTFNLIYADGYVYGEGADYNGNGLEKELFVYGSAYVYVNMNSSSYVNLIKEVADDDDETEFTTGHVRVDYGDHYFYRLSMVTGQNKLTNVVLYDFLEEYAQDPNGNIVHSSGNRDYWTGSFASLDLSSALKKSYIDNVDVYYSPERITEHGLYIDANGENVDSGAVAGAILNEKEWTLYEEGTTDPANVSSLAFDFKNKNGTYATIPATEKVSITIEMEAPADRDYYTYAYNGVWTKWTALGAQFGDDIIPDITGINSNIVTVALPHSGQASVKLDIEKTQAVVVDGTTGKATQNKPTKGKLEVKEGDIVRYFLTVTNTGNTAAKDILITDQVPQGLELIKDSISDDGKVIGRVIMWTLDYLDNTEGSNTKTVFFDVRVPENKDMSHWVNVGRVTYDDNDDPDDERTTEQSNEVEIERYGKLTISKTVTGSGSKTEPFSFKVTLTPAEGTELADSYPCIGSGAPAGGVLKLEKQSDGSAAATVTLKHGQSITITGLQAGTRYTVEELNYGDYTVTVEGDDDYADDTAIGTGEVIVDEELTLVFTNDKEAPEEPDTPETPKTPDDPKGNTARTGDDSRPRMWVLLMATTLVGMLGTLYCFDRKNKRVGAHEKPLK